jgi:hypothetical protein
MKTKTERKMTAPTYYKEGQHKKKRLEDKAKKMD